jgi:hypothetical protein
MTTCPRISLFGTPCELDEGHTGNHQKTYPDHNPITWSDEGEKRFLKEHGDRLGT